MDPKYLLDTNVCIYIRQNRPEQVMSRFRRLRPGEAAVGGTPRFCACAANELTQTAIKDRTFKDRLISETPS